MMENYEMGLLSDIVNDFEELVSLNTKRLAYGLPESALPYPRNIIEESIERLYVTYSALYKQNKNPALKKYLDSLELAYSSLGYFLPQSEIAFRSKPNNELQQESFLQYVEKLLQRQGYYQERLKQIKERLE